MNKAIKIFYKTPHHYHQIIQNLPLKVQKKYKIKFHKQIKYNN